MKREKKYWIKLFREEKKMNIGNIIDDYGTSDLEYSYDFLFMAKLKTAWIDYKKIKSTKVKYYHTYTNFNPIDSKKIESIITILEYINIFFTYHHWWKRLHKSNRQKKKQDPTFKWYSI